MRQPVDHILTPEMEKHFFQEQLLPPLLRGECASVFWVPHGGIKTKMVYFTKNADFYGLSKIGKYKVVYINPYEMRENTPNEYFRLMLNSNSFSDLKHKASNLLKDNTHIIFLLGEFSKINFRPNFFNNLLCLHQLARSRVHYVFNFTHEVCINEEINKYDQLLPVIEQNKIYFPLSGGNDSKFMLEKFIRQYNYQISADQKLLIIELAGGHPALMRICLLAINKNPFLKKNQALLELGNLTEVEIVLEDIWQSLSVESKRFLFQLVNSSLSKNPGIPFSLEKRKIIWFEKGKVSLFSPLFAEFVKKKQIKRQITIKEGGGQVLIDGLPVTKKITFSEHQILKTFLESPGKIITRDMLAEALWGEESYEKYSDWAIDRLTYRLRKKIEQWDIRSSSIQTVKGRGYRWLSD